jgi:acetylornithine deacetylase/succinyl-diaminopimelate desuccinylase-like protein
MTNIETINLEAVNQAIDDSFDEHLQRTQAFIRQPSISADGTGMREMAEMVANEIRELGGTEDIVPTTGHPVVYGHVDAGAKTTLLLYGMYDVQPVTGEDWRVPPFSGEIVELEGFGPSMVSRGIMNSKGPMIGFFNAMRTLKSVLGTLPVNLKFVVEGEEELGSRNLPSFVAENKDRLAADAAIFPFYSQDLTGKVIMYLGVKGLVFLELTCRGGSWGAPTTRDVHGMNAVWFHSPAWSLVHALSTMLTHDQKRILFDELYDDVQPPSAEDLALLDKLGDTFDETTQMKDYEVERFKYNLGGVDLLRQFLYEPSLNINGIKSGHTDEGTKTVLPHQASAKIDVRLVPRMKPEKVVEQVRRHLDRHGFGYIDVKQHSGYPASKGSISDAANEPMMQAYRSLGFEPEVWPLVAGAAPFYLFTQELGMPLCIGGLGHGGRQHSPNEYATVEGMRLFEKSAAAFVMNFAAHQAVAR